MTDKPLTPKERVDAHDKKCELVTLAIPQSICRCRERQLAAELEEANERAQKWAEEAGRYAALTDFWRKRALADERQLIEKDEQIAALEREL